MRILYLILLIDVFQQQAIEPLIKAKLVQRNTASFYLATELCKKYVIRPLCLCYPEDINLEELAPSIVDIPLICNIIPVIWFSGNQYSIEEMDEDLYYSLIKIKTFFQRFFYNTSWQGELIPKHLTKNNIPDSKNQPATLFSGGLDSTATLFRHIDKNPLLISFNNIHKTAVKFANYHQLNQYTIRTNYNDFLKLKYLDKASVDISKWFWDTTMGLSWVGMAAPFLYAKGISTLCIPSGFTWQSFIFPDGQTLQQPACPLIDENLSPMGLEVIHDAFTMTRTDKIRSISNFCTQRNITKPQLIVCNCHPRSDITYTHCNTCFKCLITMLDILAIGEHLQDYGFTLSDEEFITQFQTYIQKLSMRQGGTFVALRDTQNYIQQNMNLLPQQHRSFYDWFISINLLEKINQNPNRPLREKPFNWDDYQDLYPKEKY